jgi:hypothetical protein
MLCENGTNAALCVSVAQGYGRGGVSRGRGDAPMTWRDPASESGVRFEDQVLPPAGLDALARGRLVGLSADAPKVEVMPADGADEGALRAAAAGGGGAHAQQVLPRHRAAVEQYFHRDG